jgi:hypothetical protein
MISHRTVPRRPQAVARARLVQRLTVLLVIGGWTAAACSDNEPHAVDQAVCGNGVLEDQIGFAEPEQCEEGIPCDPRYEENHCDNCQCVIPSGGAGGEPPDAGPDVTEPEPDAEPDADGLGGAGQGGGASGGEQAGGSGNSGGAGGSPQGCTVGSATDCAQAPLGEWTCLLSPNLLTADPDYLIISLSSAFTTGGEPITLFSDGDDCGGPETCVMAVVDQLATPQYLAGTSGTITLTGDSPPVGTIDTLRLGEILFGGDNTTSEVEGGACIVIESVTLPVP